MRLRKRLPADEAQVLRLLATAALPPDGLDQTEGWVIEEEGTLVGHVAVEPTLDALVLRSLAVAPTQRGKGFGERLVAEAEASAAGRTLVLKTDTVGPWMERRGYRRATLDQVPPSVRTTTQFSGTLCSSTPIYIKETTMDNDTIKAAVRERYAGFVTKNTSCCGPKSACGCSGTTEDPSLRIGYASQDVGAVPEGANLGLGCGNPVALASLKPGETVLDLGSGAGFDAFLASKRVGPEGRVIGVDMTPEMIARSRNLAERHGYANVEFRQGDIEQLPVEDAAVDAIISNCVINLTTDKAKAFREAFRVMKPGGRLMVSDLVLLKPLPEALLRDMDAYAACISGALLKDDYLAAIRQAGFQSVEIVGESQYDLGEPEHAESPAEGSDPSGTDLWAASKVVVSVQIQATKPLEAAASSQPACCQSCCPNP
jgi:SAM-dependent methyltransferase/N-acetylglutamate synthase-like GNAT family acetyltransferase